MMELIQSTAEGIGILPGDRPGYWGDVTGFDFCERNYDTSYYVGEFWNTWTNWISCPVYFAIVMYIWRSAPEVKLTPLTWFYLTVGCLDMFCAGASHFTMRLFWTQKQEEVLTFCFLTGFIVIVTRYHGDPLTKFLVLLNNIAYFIQIGYGAYLDYLSEDHIDQFNYPNSYFTIMNLVTNFSWFQGFMLALWVLAGRGDYYTRIFLGQSLFITPAFFIFGITTVSAGECLSLPIWLHELGHMLGAVDDFLALIMVLSLDPEVRTAFRPGVKFGFIPFLVKLDEEDLEAWGERFPKTAKEPLTNQEVSPADTLATRNERLLGA